MLPEQEPRVRNDRSMASQEKLKEYDEEPITYCANCYSLKIKYEEAFDTDCCMECGSTTMRESSIEEWERLYEKRYGKKYVEKSDNLKNSPMFTMPIGKLKKKLFDSPKMNIIIKEMYPDFPNGFSKADSVILLFDKVVKDNRLDDLRLLMIKYI